MAKESSWELFTNSGIQRSRKALWPEAPPWRQFRRIPLLVDRDCAAEASGDLDFDAEYWKSSEDPPPASDSSLRRGKVFRLPRGEAGKITSAGERVRLAVNAAIHLRRPLLVTGAPGCGKTSLAHAIAWELDLGPVLHWPITPRTQLVENGLYQYDALGRLHDSQFPLGVSSSAGSTEAKKPAVPSTGVNRFPVADYITLGPVGTAFLPFSRPRVLLIDELDKSDIQLPNELLNLFEEGEYEIPQLVREAKRSGDANVPVRTADPGCMASIAGGKVQCREFPIVVMTSNRERDFPAAFHRRCIRVEMPQPAEKDTLRDVVRSHFTDTDRESRSNDQDVFDEIENFLGDGSQLDRATDQLLNALFLLTIPKENGPSEDHRLLLREILYRGLHERDSSQASN